MKENKNNILEIKISNIKLHNFQAVLEGFLANGYDFLLQEGQSEVWFYLEEPHGFNLILKSNGTWTIN